jgi:hypothetical protein
MSDFVAFGLPGIDLERGDHICAFHFGEAERDEIVLPYLRAGLVAGDKCVCIVDQTTPSEIVAGMVERERTLDLDTCVRSRQLEVLGVEDTYLRGGRFSTLEMLAFFRSMLETATTSEGYQFARIAGEASWVLGDSPGAEEFIDYESELNDFVPEYPQAVLCLYDLKYFGGSMLVDLLRTHPKLLLGGLIVENPHYLTPDEFRALPR